MASRNSSRGGTARATQDADASSQLQEAAGQASRQQLSMLTQTTAVMLRGAAAWQEAQQHLLERSGAAYQEAAGKMQQATNPADLMVIQAGLMMSGVQQALQFSQDLMRAGTALQSDIGGSAGTSQETAAPGLDAMAPVMQAWQQLFTSPLNGARSRPH